MNILVIGGSYFCGKCFVQKASENHQVSVLNRGSRRLDPALGVKAKISVDKIGGILDKFGLK